MTQSPVWHPFTQHGLGQAAIAIARAEGAWLETAAGARLLDAISSWWVVTHGHRQPAIMAAIKDQADKLDQIIFAGFTHEPAEQLARELIGDAPPGLAHVFYSDSGSTAVEVALKMALGYWRNVGEPRMRILALEHAYHGDTVGTMSAGARGVFTASYAPLLFDVGRVPFPGPGREQIALDALAAALKAEPVAALIVEPLILGAGGMLVYPAWVLAEMARLCAAHGALFIADEVMTGWGRTGTLFACEQAGITPDILCTAKGLTGGALSLAATLCVPKIFDAHVSNDRATMFFHSSSYTANPVACAAALANLHVWRDEPVMERVTALVGWQGEQVARFADDARFSDVRQCGTITALDLGVGQAGYLADVGPRMARWFVEERGVLLRPLGNTIYVMPPYCITRAELAGVYDVIAEAADRFGGAA
jgi:adenosylmethionine---8-amino-7-oxononanoate aminotransferase